MSPRLNTHTEPTLTPEQQADLAALDAALRGDSVDDAALATLVREVRAAAPVMAPDARQELNERVAAGFPRRGVRRLGALRLPLTARPRRGLRPDRTGGRGRRDPAGALADLIRGPERNGVDGDRRARCGRRRARQ